MCNCSNIPNQVCDECQCVTTDMCEFKTVKNPHQIDHEKEFNKLLETEFNPKDIEKQLLSEASKIKDNEFHWLDSAKGQKVPDNSKAIKHDQGKAELSILPIEGLKYEAAALTYGKGKYGKGNFKLGMEYSRLIDAALRHIYAYAGKEDLDKESNLHHLAHAKATLAMLIYMIENNVGKDDR